MRVVVAGGTGFIGRALVGALSSVHHEVFVLSRTARPGLLPGTMLAMPQDLSSELSEEVLRSLDGSHAIINLAGTSLNEGRWNAAQKAMIHDSRVLGTARLVQACGRLARPPLVLLSASAVGFYGQGSDEIHTERDGPGDDFLAHVCRDWESAAQAAEGYGTHVVLIRIGMVLGRGGGALAKLLPLYRAGLGGPMGSGRQWISWIHIDDLIRAILFLLEHPSLSGPFNACAPQAVRQREFSQALGHALKRPARLTAPAPLLRLLLGESADALLLGGQRVAPERLEAAGFAFALPDLENAMRELLTP